jgi:hypothetical protein
MKVRRENLDTPTDEKFPRENLAIVPEIFCEVHLLKF